MMIFAMHPYSGCGFFQFFLVFFHRMGEFCLGKKEITELVSDEIQILILCCVAFSCALIGTLLVLKKMTMLANSLSHTLLLGIIIAYLILIPFSPLGDVHTYQISLKILCIASFCTALLTSVFTQVLTDLLKLSEDASVGFVFTSLFALGIVLVTIFTRNAHLGTEAIMGNVDALHLDDLRLVIPVACFNLLTILIFYKEFKISLFDSSFATSQGFSSHFFHYLLMVLTSATVISAFRAVGVLLVLSLIVSPVLIARLFTDRLKTVMIFAVGIGLLTSLFSVAIARYLLNQYQYPVSTAGLVVTLLGSLYLISAILKRFLPRFVRTVP